MDDQQNALRDAVQSVLRQQAAASPDPGAFLDRTSEDLTDVLVHAKTAGNDVVSDMAVRARLAAAVSDVVPFLRREFRRIR